MKKSSLRSMAGPSLVIVGVLVPKAAALIVPVQESAPQGVVLAYGGDGNDTLCIPPAVCPPGEPGLPGTGGPGPIVTLTGSVGTL